MTRLAASPKTDFTACTSGVHNIGHAARVIAYGDADAMVAGGAEKASTPL
ncbi:beta-ketoacyl synthase N-terminal-like domain-containing protein, partial [Klebsiella michiganensis]